MKFAALEQRILHGYRTMFPAFWPNQNAPVCAEGQKAFYDFMKNLYQMLFDDPALEAQVLKIETAVEGLLKKYVPDGRGRAGQMEQAAAENPGAGGA